MATFYTDGDTVHRMYVRAEKDVFRLSARATAGDAQAAADLAQKTARRDGIKAIYDAPDEGAPLTGEQL